MKLIKIKKDERNWIERDNNNTNEVPYKDPTIQEVKVVLFNT